MVHSELPPHSGELESNSHAIQHNHIQSWN